MLAAMYKCEGRGGWDTERTDPRDNEEVRQSFVKGALHRAATSLVHEQDKGSWCTKSKQRHYELIVQACPVHAVRGNDHINSFLVDR